MLSRYLVICAIAFTANGVPNESDMSGGDGGLEEWRTSNLDLDPEPALRPGALPDEGDLPLLNRKVFNGYRVNIEEHPYVVSVRRHFAHYLVGTMLSRTLVITVAHPLHRVPLSSLAVVAGEHYCDRGAQLLTVLLLVEHRQFDPDTLHHDLALLQLLEDAPYTYKVKPILGTWGESFDFTGETGFVTGWGRCDTTGNELCFPRSSQYHPNEYIDPMLKTVQIDLTRNNTGCDNYDSLSAGLRGPSWLCVGCAGRQRSPAPCLGVPGAPLVVDGRLLGVLSCGFGCPHSHRLPLIYTDIRLYTQWISSNMDVSMGLSKKVSALFEATKSYKLLEWINQSRGHAQIKWHETLDADVQPLEDDKSALSKFDGIVYDVRDYVVDGRFMESKQQMLGMVRVVMTRVEETLQLQQQAKTDEGLDRSAEDSTRAGTEEAVAAYDYGQDYQHVTITNNDDLA